MKILIIRLSSLGDIVLTQPVAATLRKNYPDAEIDFVTKPQFVELVRLFKEVNTVIPWESISLSKKALQAKQYDIIIDLHKKGTSFIIKKICSGKRIVSYDKKHFLRLAIIKKWTSKSLHSTLDLYNSALKKLHLKPIYDSPKLKLNTILDLTPDETLKIAVFPGAVHPTKRLPLTKWVQLCNQISKKWEVEFFINGSSNEKKLCEQLCTEMQSKQKQDLSGSQNLTELADFLSRMDLVFTNDSGPMHLTAALGKKQIAFFGSTNTRLGFRPLNENAIVFQTLLPCQPCALHGRKKCPLNHFKCMNNIDINVVLEELEKWI